jgi:O-antigen/teichoic acid export membrane protein
VTDSERSPFSLAAFRRGVALTGSGSVLSIGFLLLEMAVAVRFLTTEAYGLYVLLISVANFLVMVSDFGLKTSVTQMIAAALPERRGAIAHSALLFRLGVCAVIITLLWPMQGLLSFLADEALLYVAYLPLLFVVASLDELLNGILQGFQQYRSLATALALRSALRFALTLAFLSVLRLGVLALVYSWILTFAVSTIFQFVVMAAPKRPAFSRAALVSLLRFGFPLQVTRYLWFAFYQVNFLLLGTLAGPASVGYYAVASRIPEAFERLFESYIAVFFPSVSALLASGKRAQADWVVNGSLRLVSFTVSLAALVCVLFGGRILGLVFSDKYAASGMVFGVLMVALQMSILVTLMGYALTAAGHPTRSLAVNSARAAVNICGNLVLIPLLGTIGPAVAVAIACHATNPLAVWLLRRSEVAVHAAPYVKHAATLLLCAGLAWLAEGLGLVSLALEPAFGLAVVGLFVGLNALLKTVSRDDFGLLLPGIAKLRPGVQKESVTYGQQ